MARPEALPPGFPVPAGTVFTGSESPFPDQHVVYGVAPGSLDSAKSFYDGSLEDAGFKQGAGESEQGEVEALWTGKGARGGWRANSIPQCDGAVKLTFVVIR